VEFRRRSFLQLATGAAALPLVPQRAFAEAYPSRPLRMIVPFAAGSAPDIIARLAGQWLSDGVGQPVIIDNRPGAASNIGTEVAVHAAPDGYTLQMTVLTNVFNAELYKNLSFNFVTDVTHVGGVAAFVGLVRDMTGGAATSAMTLEHYPGMTEKKLGEIEAEAQRRWPLSASLIIHRYGRLLPGDRIVLVATASSHRQAALEACAFLIDWLKTAAPFWKLEETPSGERWVEARAADDVAARRWAEPAA